MDDLNNRLGPGGKILVIDDDPFIAEFLTTILTHNGYHVLTGSDPTSVNASVVENEPDLILLDVLMPGMNGFEVCENLKKDERTKNVPVIFISASGDVSDHVQGFVVGGIDFVTKPLDERIVLERVATHRRFSDALKSLRKREKELQEYIRDLKATRENFEQQAMKMAEMAKNEAALKEQAKEDELRIRAIFETVSDAFIVIDRKGIIEAFNGGAQSIFGYSSKEIIGQNISTLMPEPYRSQHDDYLERTKGISGKTVIGTTRDLLGKRKNGETFPISLTLNSLSVRGEVKYTGVVRDETERKKAEEEIKKLAMTDQLTGLANRNQYHRRFREHLQLAGRENTLLALMLLDLDKFKPVNDTYGHPVGDALLQTVGANLTECSRSTDVVARLGGDEFAILLVHPKDILSIELRAQRVVDLICRPMNIMGHDIQIGTSIGISIYPFDANDEENLTRKADQALYEAKKAGRNTYRLFNSITPRQE